MHQFDDLESSREGAGQRDTSAHLVCKHLEDIGLDGDIAQYNEISGLSGGKKVYALKYDQHSYPRVGQKIKLVIAACLRNNPQVNLHLFQDMSPTTDEPYRSVSLMNRVTSWIAKPWVASQLPFGTGLVLSLVSIYFSHLRLGNDDPSMYCR